MGYIAEMARKSSTKDKLSLQGGRVYWREVFGTNKEESKKPTAIEGGSHGRSMVSSDTAIKRLLQAMRSMAPGGWSDDRWEQSRHFFGITYVGIHRQNEMFMQADFEIFHKVPKSPKNPDGKIPVTENDPPQGDRFCKPYDLVKLLEKPNRDDCFGDLMSNWNLNMDLTGMGLTWMVPNQLGVPVELYPIPTPLAIPQPAVNPDYPDGYYRIQPVYPYGPFSSYPTPTSAVGAAIPAQWMMRFKYAHPFLRYDGWSPMTALRQQIDGFEDIDKSRTNSMRRSIRPSAVLNMEDMEGAQALPEPEIDRIRAQFAEAHMSPDNHGNLIVAAPGAHLEQWGQNPVDMDYPNGWDQLSSFILGGLGTTKPAAGMSEDSNYATLFATLKQLYWLTLDPKAHRIAQKLTRHVAPFFGDDLIVEIKCRRIDDHEITFQAIDKGIQAKCITKNEIRHKLEWPLTEEEWGDDIAGDPSPKEEEQQQQQAQQQQEQQQMQSGEQNGIKKGALQNDKPKEDKEMEKGRPNPGSLGHGSLGPRKGLEIQQKSLYQQIRDAIHTNGNGNGNY